MQQTLDDDYVEPPFDPNPRPIDPRPIDLGFLTLDTISSFIGKAGVNVKALSAKYGRSCRIQVDKDTGSVTATNCNDPTGLYHEVQAFIKSGGGDFGGGGGDVGFGGGGGGGGGGGRNGGHGRRR
jgi:uncharacterized membrane protein YgcG